MSDALRQIAELLERAAVPYAVIGAHAVNAWAEPRFTADLDVTACATREDMERLRRALGVGGYVERVAHGGSLPSGPDFVRFVSRDGGSIIEVQAAKTDLQRSVVDRALRLESGLRVATVEDLLVLKLIADRPKDQGDLASLSARADIDWSYVERWCREWEIEDRLRRLRARLSR